jgi:hypothetical protein
MTPNKVLDAIAQNLLEMLSPASEPLVRVLVSDSIDEDVSDSETFQAPAVVLSCTGFGDQSLSAGAMLVDGEMVARCYARLPAGASDARTSRGDVAMNLAALVAQAVEGTLWTGADGKPVVVRLADRVRVQNRTGRALLVGEGLAMWTVRWVQRFELNGADTAETLRTFKTLFVQWDMGGADTPQETELIEVTHG